MIQGSRILTFVPNFLRRENMSEPLGLEDLGEALKLRQSSRLLLLTSAIMKRRS